MFENNALDDEPQTEVLDTETSAPDDDNADTVYDPADTLTFTVKRNHFYAAITPLTFVLGLAVGYLFWGRNAQALASTGPQSLQQAAVPIPAAPTPIQRFDVSVDDDPALGPPDAPVTVIEFSDFECPFCARFHAQTLRPLLEAYPDQIRFVYRDFPISSIHSNAQPAAEAAQCANEQDRFWEFHDLLFQDQESLGPALYSQAASSLGLDMAAFEECVQSGRYAQEVNADFDAGRSLGVTGTPTFFINGRPLVGAQPLTAFTAIIDAELAAAR